MSDIQVEEERPQEKRTCKVVLKEGPICSDRNDVLRYVVCKARYYAAEGMDFGEAMKKSWREAKNVCKIGKNSNAED